MTDDEIKLFLTRHEGFTESLTRLIKTMLDSAGIKYHLVESRTKKFDSLKEKLERKTILDLKTEVTDLSGVRIILYYQNDILNVEKAIKENFQIDKDNSVNKADTLAKNEFGYLSVHYIVNIKEERSKLVDWKGYEDLNAEIQVRTILQHSWAALNQELVYKKKGEMPIQLERKLFRLASLFELADEQFEELKNKDNEITKQFKNRRMDKIFEDEPLNLVTLKSDLENKNSRIKEIVEVGYQSGFDKSDYDIQSQELSKILLASEILDIKTFNNLYETLHNTIVKLKPTLDEMLNSGVSRSGKWSGSYSFLTLITLLLNMNNQQLDYYKENALFSRKLWSVVRKAVINNR